MSKVCVIGGGAAGMMAAIAAARNGHHVTIFEKNEKLGKKLFITGKGRCNLTNACDIEQLFISTISNPKFLYSAFYGFDNMQSMEFFRQLGLKIKVERGDRVFPVSDKSSDVIGVLEEELKRLSVDIKYRTEVEEIIVSDNIVEGIRIKEQKKDIYFNRIIIATGGLSYPSTGSTGDGYRFARELGHTIKKLSPALVPFQIRENYVKELQGLSLKNVQVTIRSGKKEIFKDFGEMLFTHFGVSGPLILSGSSYSIPYLKKGELTLSIDLKPALSVEQLDNRLLREFSEMQNKQFKNVLDKLLPKKLIPVMIKISGINMDKKVNLITKEERKHFIDCLKNMEMHIEGVRGYNEAIITQGGVTVKEINPSTMESQLVQGLYFAGEVLDLDALTGGFNLQIAWSTAYTAGNAIQ